MAKTAGLGVQPPRKDCGDRNCPFHGWLRVSRRIIEGKVVRAKMQRTVIVQRDYVHYVKKFSRYERRLSRIPAHSPPCMEVEEGDAVKIAECRPISKTVSFVVVEKTRGGPQA